MINRRKEAAQGFLYILPSLVLILVFSVVPILMSLYFSFTKYNVLQPPQWTGLDNYIRLFRDPYVRASLKNTVVFTVITVPLQTAGSLVLAAFAFYLFRKNPARSLSTPSEQANTYWKDFVTGFLLTFSNPLILFFIIGLFARFNFLLPEFKYYHYISGYIAIFSGALLWWFTITFFVNKVRSHFNVRSLWLINRIIGGILLIMAIIGLIMGIKDYITVIQ
ncbi:LysE family transporter [uncultured Muribaculum sp.]|uniref:LysE family transporter n=1 Tax=uncultured Muribaculum sp. TaxID=1918613 RepID=UPI0026594738|nr:LysE family transporter [uncultured Muribaculum sp.]